MNLVRPSRLELTALLDVLLILLIAWQARAPDDLSSAADETTDEQEELADEDESADELAAEVARANELQTQLDAATRERDEALAAQASAESRADSAESTRDSLSDALAQAELYEETSTNAQAALQEFLQSRITIVEILVSREQVREYRRYGAPSWSELRPPIALVERRDTDGDGQVDASYVGDFFARFADEVDNSLVQRGPDDDVFYLLVPDDDSPPTYIAAEGLRAEARSNRHLRVFGP